MARRDTTACPACGKTVDILGDGVLAGHDRTPDPIDGVEQGPERCRWSFQPVDLIADATKRKAR